jgi:acetate kinase
VRVLVVNAGSSSMKLRLLSERDEVLGTADLPANAAGFDAGQLDEAVRPWDTPDVVGHRVVHGGVRYAGAVLLDDGVRKRLAEFTDLAPLHQPKSLAALDLVTAQLPDVPAVGCFDTAFHATIPPAAATYPVPLEWRERYGIRRYGFHGLSHAYCSRRAAELLGRAVDELRIVTCHLGAGASLTAVAGGRSVDTTMGFTPLEGLMMATRSGTVDPGLVLWLEEHEGLSPREVSTVLEKRSGFVGLAGTADIRDVQDRAIAGEPDAQLALDVFVHRLVTGIGAMSASAGGLDVLVFTGGVGEHSPIIRQMAAERLAYLGVAVDDAANEAGEPDSDVTAASGATVRTLVIAAREDLQIARESRLVVEATLRR